jgi:glutamyl-tRNA synthetase
LRLGWAHKDDEIISRKQAIEWFDLDGLGKSPARLDFAKMSNLNAHYLRQLDDRLLTQMITEILQRDIQITSEEIGYIELAIPGLKTRSTTLLELAELAKIYLVNSPVSYSEEAQKVISNCDQNLLSLVIQQLESLQDFDKDGVQETLKEIAKSNQMKLGDLMQPIRALLTGQVTSPSVFEIAAIIGKANTITRLRSVKHN